MQKKIFIGGAFEAHDQATKVAKLLQSFASPLIWTKAFPVNDLTFASIENVSSTVDGAILLATPDDDSNIRGKKFKVPRANVLFEYGYLTASLGRSRVALCVYEGTELPSDFAGLT